MTRSSPHKYYLTIEGKDGSFMAKTVRSKDEAVRLLREIYPKDERIIDALTNNGRTGFIGDQCTVEWQRVY